VLGRPYVAAPQVDQRERLDPSSSPRALLGAELRHAREKAGLSQEELGQRLFVSGSFIGQLEAGTRRMQREYARLLDEALGTEDFFQRHCVAAAKSKYPEHFAEAVEAEAEATEIWQYAPLLISGLLQTPAYARAVFRAYRPTTGGGDRGVGGGPNGQDSPPRRSNRPLVVDSA
jgi:transcriptional regulator with XRE-family HTH domain